MLFTFVIIVVNTDFLTITMKGFPKVGGNGDGCDEHCSFLGKLSLMQQIVSKGNYIYIYKEGGRAFINDRAFFLGWYLSFSNSKLPWPCLGSTPKAV
jgi:hypothetical protein